jgi:hypothetical protein
VQLGDSRDIGRFLAAALASLLACGATAACSSDATASTNSGSCASSTACSGDATVSTGSIAGSWYGTGPDGDQCFVVCDNGKFFSGDRPCTELTAGDFTKFLSYTRSGSTLSVTYSTPQCWLATSPCAQQPMVWSLSGDTATVDWCGFTLNLQRTADAPFCDDPTKTPC